ncbi:MAG: glycosyltransferase [Lachnospiraceae bacterium]|nr:glycosyltransferase [Lachnospiraceae bacterium]
MSTKENLDKNFISAVVYMNTAGSAEKLREFLEGILKSFEENWQKFEVILVDDDTDESYIKVARECKEKHESASVTILHMSTYQGMEMSMNAGRDLAIGDFVFEFDECSYNFPEDQIKLVYDECLKDYDIVSCSDDRKNSVSSNGFYGIFNRFSDIEYKLESDNFRILSRRGINRIQSLNRAIPYRKAMYANCGLKLKNISYKPTAESDYSHDKREKKTRRMLAFDSLLLFTGVGFKLTLTLSLIMAAVMIFSAIYAIVMYVSGIAIEGWTTTMLFLSFAFFGLFVILTVVIKYLSLILNLNFKKQRYMFESVEKL